MINTWIYALRKQNHVLQNEDGWKEIGSFFKSIRKAGINQTLNTLGKKKEFFKTHNIEKDNKHGGIFMLNVGGAPNGGHT